MEKNKTLTINTKDFSAYLLGRKGNRTVAELAESLGISERLAYSLLSGERVPSKKVLAKLDGHEETVYVFELAPAKK